MKKMQTAVMALTAATVMALVGAGNMQADHKPKGNPPTNQQSPVPSKNRSIMLAVDPADVSVDQFGNVVIKDTALAAEVRRLQATGRPERWGNLIFKYDKSK
jgi:hypothetical protein